MRYAITAQNGDEMLLESYTAANSYNLAFSAICGMIEAVKEEAYELGYREWSIRVEYIDHEDVTHEFHMWVNPRGGYDATVDGNFCEVDNHWDEVLSNWL